MFPVPSSGHALAGIARNLRWCKRQRLNSIQPLSILDTNIPSRLRSTGNSAERILEKPRAQQDNPSIMNASDFRYMFPNVFPPAGTQMPSLMSSQNPPSSFNPFAPTFVPVPHGQGQRRSPSPQVALTPSQTKVQNRIVANTRFRSNRSPRRAKSPQFPPQDERTQPSAASGGVPNPSPTYLVHASLPPLLLPHPRQILVVIDLNGTLLYRPSRKNPSQFVERPHARRFLAYCVETFTVVIWSSAKPDNVRRMCAQLMTPEQHERVVAIWGRDKFGLSSPDYNRRVQCYKRLSALWGSPEVARSHPAYASGGRWSQANTVLVDDSLEKARSEPYNLIQIPEFMGDHNEAGYILPQVHDYINECSRQADISTYIRMLPFQSKANFELGSSAS